MNEVVREAIPLSREKDLAGRERRGSWIRLAHSGCFEEGGVNDVIGMQACLGSHQEGTRRTGGITVGRIGLALTGTAIQRLMRP